MSSTYINNPNYQDAPKLLADFLNYSQTIRGLSPRSVNAYYIDLRLFFRYTNKSRGIVPKDTLDKDISIDNVDIDFIKQVTKSEVYDFLYYATNVRSNSATARARKLSSLKSFFKYLTSKINVLEVNPVADIDMPVIKKRLPKYLTLDESKTLLNSMDKNGKDYKRNFCMIILFLNCGMRLSELININILDIKDDTLRIIGKGDKERIVYLNEVCIHSINDWIEDRKTIEKIYDTDALFISRKTGKRLTARRVQQIIKQYLVAAGFANKGYTVHKLRHTAATLMYQYGNADMLSLKEILGHSNVSTTQIYTHLDVKQLKNIAKASPLATFESDIEIEEDIEKIKK